MKSANAKLNAINDERHFQIHIIGSNKLQNDLLVTALTKKTGIKTYCYLHLDIDEVLAKNKKYMNLLLIDSREIKFEKHMAELKRQLSLNSPKKFLVAIFNASPDQEMDQLAVEWGIRGIFYEDEAVEKFPRFVLAILKGELWYPRCILSEHIILSKANGYSKADSLDLTLREKEILKYIAKGSTNKKIADELSISPHTVRTHIYNIYKKIDVPNRFQASLWFTKYV